MEELIQAIASQIKFTVLQSADIEEAFPLELKRKEVAKMLGQLFFLFSFQGVKV